MYVEKVHLGFKDGEGILMGYSFPNIPSPNMEPMITLYVTVPIKLQNLEKQGSKKKLIMKCNIQNIWKSNDLL